MRFFPILLLGVMIGCDRGQQAGPASQPAGNPQPSAAHIEPANTPTTGPIERDPAVVMIDQKPITFPPAILRVRNRDGQLTAVLMSDDPKQAIDDNYHGNSFYFELPLDVSDAKQLPNSDPFVYKAPSSEANDSPNGIFLDGNHIRLQPSMMQIKFENADPGLVVVLSGQFLQFETRDDTLAPQHVQAAARLDAVVKEAK